jgi:mRNA interferase RelE/StbE
VADPPYRYRFAPRAVRDLERLPEAVAAACVEFIAADLRGDPHRVGKPLRGRLAGLWSARRGPYRIIYRLHDTERPMEVVHVEHREHAYR